jgi:Integral membrane protein CcmA involved in cell shape determination
MSFFKEFKDDFSQAVNELVPEDELLGGKISDDEIVNTLEPDNVLENKEEKNMEEAITEDDILEAINRIGNDTDKEDVNTVNTFDEGNIDKDLLDMLYVADTDSTEKEEMKEEMKEEVIEEKAVAVEETPVVEKIPEVKAEDESMEQKEEKKASAGDVTVITKGTKINGSIISDGSLEVMGTINGDIDCAGKLSIVGNVTGNSIASEIFVNTSRLEGSLNSEGSVKIGVGTVVIGDVTATSGVIAGAVKGEIDVNGPVIVDSTAVIKGNINAKSVQINNGAVLDGYCKLSYAEVDIDNFFDLDK